MVFEAFRSVINKDVSMPAYRQRVFSGFPQHRNFGNIFKAGIFTVEGEQLEPSPLAALGPTSINSPRTPRADGATSPRDQQSGSRSQPKWIFLINRSTPESIVDLIAGLQIQGLAQVIQERHSEDVATELGIASIFVNIGDGLSVAVRKNQRVNVDGSIGFTADLDVSISSNDTFDTTFNTAIEVAREQKILQPPPRQITPAYFKRGIDEDFATMAYPSLEFRLLALFRFWNVIQYFFPYKPLLDRDWDEILTEFIPKMENAKNALEYNLVIAELVANCKDSHASVSSPLLNQYIGTHVPPIELKLLEGKTVVSHIYDPALMRPTENSQLSANASSGAGTGIGVSGLAIGDQVMSIQSETVETRRKKLSMLLSASTPQGMEWKIHQKLLAGEKDSAVIMDVLTKEGTVLTVTMVRSVIPPTRAPVRPTYCVLSEGFGFIDTVNLAPSDVEKALEVVKDTKGLILDIRGYPKGTIYQLAPRLASKKVSVAVTQTPFLFPSMIYSELESCIIEEVHRIQPSSQWKYTGKVVALISEETISHAEHSCLYLEACCNATFIGTATNGTNGNVTNCSLPGGILVAFTGLGALHANREQLQRRGVQPHIPVEQTIEDLRRGVDGTLEAAIKFLKRGESFSGVNNNNINNINISSNKPMLTNITTPPQQQKQLGQAPPEKGYFV